MTRRVLPFGISTLAGILAAVVALLVIDASLLRIPVLFDRKIPSAVQKRETDPAQDGAKDYKAVTERNLFRAKLQAEIPKPKSEKEIEEEALANVMKPMTLKGVMTGAQKRDYYAVIDRGGQKGVWTYEVGETIERGLTVTDIRKDAVVVEKGDFAAILKLFAKAFERIPATAQAAVPAKEPASREDTKSAGKGQAPQKAVDYNKELKKEGKTLVISKSLAEKMRDDNSLLLSALTIKLSTDSAGKTNGYRVVGVDKGSLAQKLGILPDDLLQEVNGFSVKNAEDLKKAHEALKNASKFDVKVLRKGKMETLRYEIR
jgi:general secretion pathway protein C